MEGQEVPRQNRQAKGIQVSEPGETTEVEGLKGEVLVIALKRPWEVGMGGNIEDPYLKLAILSCALEMVHIEIRLMTNALIAKAQADNERTRKIVDMASQRRRDA